MLNTTASANAVKYATSMSMASGVYAGFQKSTNAIDLNNFYRSKLKNSLTYLLSHGHFELARTLIQARVADLNETDEWWILNPNINLALKKRLLVRRDRFRIVSHLQPSAPSFSNANSHLDPPTAMPVGRTPLMLCSMIEDGAWAFSLAQMLIENGADLGAKDSLGYTALMYACLYERSNIMQLFLNAPGGDFGLFDKDSYGNTVFHLASLSGEEKMCLLCRQLADKLGFGKQKLNTKNRLQHQPIELCSINGHQTCLRHFIESESSKGPKNALKMSSLLNMSDQLTRSKTSSSILLQSNVFMTTTTNRLPIVNDLKTLQQLSSLTSGRKRLLSAYNMVLYLKEPLIKFTEKRRKRRQPTREAITRDELRSSIHSQAPIIITRTPKKSITAMDFNPYETSIESFRSKPAAPSVFFDSNSTTYFSESMRGADLADLSSLSWRKNVEKLFETVEFQRTKSYRTPSSNSSSNLFEQLMGTDASSAAAAAAPQGGERKNSLKTKAALAQAAAQTKEFASSSGQRQSVSTQKSISSLKRGSIASLKNS